MMTADNIKISLSEAGQRRDISEVRVDGVIDTLTAGEFEEVIDSLLKRERYRIIVDLAGVDYISSAGWGIFISHIKDVRDREGDIKLAAMIPNVYEIYELLEFDNVLQAHETVDAARSSFDPNAVPVAKAKRSSEITRVTVVDSLIQDEIPVGSEQTADKPVARPAQKRDLVTAVMETVAEDPFMTISEIRSDLNLSTEFDDIGWWQIFGILRQRNMLRKKSRFRYARHRRR